MCSDDDEQQDVQCAMCQGVTTPFLVEYWQSGDSYGVESVLFYINHQRTKAYKDTIVEHDATDLERLEEGRNRFVLWLWLTSRACRRFL